MATIYATNDGSVGAATTQWNKVHDAADGKNAYFSSTHRDTAVVAGMADATIFRVFMDFDTSGITTTPTTATLKVYGKTNDTSDIIVVKGTQSAFNEGTFNDLHGWTFLYNNTHLTAYSAEISSWSTSGYNDITLNATALSDMASLSTFKIAIIDYDYDYLDVQPPTPSNVSVGMYFTLESGIDKDPYIDYTVPVSTYPSEDQVSVTSGTLTLSSDTMTIK